MVISSWQWQELGKAASLQQALPELEAETPWPKPCQHADLIRSEPAANSCYPWLERGDEGRTESSDSTTVVTVPWAQPLLTPYNRIHVFVKISHLQEVSKETNKEQLPPDYCLSGKEPQDGTAAWRG